MHAFLPPVPRHVEALRAMLSCHGNHRDQLLEETSAWEEDISWAFRVLKTFRAGTPRGHSLMIFGQKGEVGWLSPDPASKATLWVKAQHEGALPPPGIVRKDPRPESFADNNEIT